MTRQEENRKEEKTNCDEWTETKNKRIEERTKEGRRKEVMRDLEVTESKYEMRRKKEEERE